jgi:hypothetical protein
VTSGALSILVLFGLLIAVFVGLFLVTDTAVAELKTTHWVDAWDFDANPVPQYAHSNVSVIFNGSWVPFLHLKDFDTRVKVTDTYTTTVNSCTITGTVWAGTMYYTLGHTDTTGERGFQETARWRLLDCDFTGDGKYDGDDRKIFPPGGTINIDNPNPGPPYPGQDIAECKPNDPVCNLISRDVISGCNNNTCSDYIVTTFFLNLDPDCDGNPDFPVVTTGTLCFYAEARTPLLAEGEGAWQGNLQTRITEAGGDKTVNFSVDPLAIDLAAFSAARRGKGIQLTWETANELDNLGFNLYRSASPVGQRAQLNGRLIASVAPGSATGATYTFLDESAAPGRRYWYWLEDLDLNGGSSQHGPAMVSGLPGRRRPMPSP